MLFHKDFIFLTSSIQGLPWTENCGFKQIVYPIIIFLNSLFIYTFGTFLANKNPSTYMFVNLPILGMIIGYFVGFIHESIDPSLLAYKSYYYVEAFGLLSLFLSLIYFFIHLKKVFSRNEIYKDGVLQK